MGWATIGRLLWSKRDGQTIELMEKRTRVVGGVVGDQRMSKITVVAGKQGIKTSSNDSVKIHAAENYLFILSFFDDLDLITKCNNRR